MKKRFSGGIVAIMAISMLLLTAGCSANNEEIEVRDYNNTIVNIQQKMLEQASNNAASLQNGELDANKSLQQFEAILANVQQSEKDFTTIKVPKGAESLSSSMSKFFEVEQNGVKSIITAIQNLKGQEKNEQALRILVKSLDDFSRNESEVMNSFNQTQQQVAAKYGKSIQVPTNK